MAFSSFSRQGGHPPPLAEINTTPLVDVMLVLLVIFLITAPVLQQAVVLDLPQASAAPLPDEPRVVRVALNAGGGRCSGTMRRCRTSSWPPSWPPWRPINPSCICAPTAIPPMRPWPA